MGKDRNSEQTSQEETLEEVFAQLDDLAEKLEDQETSLEESFALYKQGMELAESICSEKLDTVEKETLQINLRMGRSVNFQE